MVKVLIRRMVDRLMYEVVIWRNVHTHDEILRENGEWEKMGTDGTYTKPTLLISTDIASVLLEELQKLGLPQPEKHKTEGLYEAQSAHLLDLQKLLKLK